MPADDFRTLIVDRVTRHFGRRRALWQVSFACHAGEILGLIGANGAGKSTLLAILATLAVPTAGRVRYGELDSAQDGAALRARIGLLGHDLGLYPELSARENLSFFGRVYRLADVARVVERALDHAQLSDRADEPISRLSRGMRQRLALERALLHGPQLILLDEPFTGLDHRSVRLLEERLGALRAAGRLIVAATHDLAVAERVFDAAVVLDRGRVAASGPNVMALLDAYRGRTGAAPGR